LSETLGSDNGGGRGGGGSFSSDGLLVGLVR